MLFWKCNNLAQSHPSKLCKLGVLWNPQDLLLMMGTEILKINAEMPEKIEVDAANPHLEIERMAKK